MLVELVHKQEETTRKIELLDEIFESRHLNRIRRGKLAIATESYNILVDHYSDVQKLLEQSMTESEISRLYVRGSHLLQDGGFQGPLSPLGIIANGADYAMLDLAYTAVAKIRRSEGYSEDDKNLVEFVANGILYGKLLKKYDREYKKHRILGFLFPTVRKGKSESQEEKIDETLEEFKKETQKSSTTDIQNQ